MGTLTPGATYVYERANGVIYAREFGQQERTIVGYDTDHTAARQRQFSKWNDILLAAESDPVLKDMIDQVEVYHTLKNPP